MKLILHEGNHYVLRFDPGEEVMEMLKKFCEAERIDSGFFMGIGAAKEAVLSSYDVRKKSYKDKVIKGQLEIGGLIGNVGTLKGKTMLHCHATISKNDRGASAGHLKEVMISATCEMILIKLTGRMERKYNDGTGLNLLD